MIQILKCNCGVRLAQLTKPVTPPNEPEPPFDPMADVENHLINNPSHEVLVYFVAA